MAFSVAESPVLYVQNGLGNDFVGHHSALVRIVVRRLGTNLPRGPTGWPLLGSLHLLSPLPHQSLARLATKHGPLMSLHALGASIHHASSPRLHGVSHETGCQFLRESTHERYKFCFAKGWNYRRLSLLITRSLTDILSQNISPTWRILRRIFHMELTGTKPLEVTRHVREEEMAHLIRALPRNQEFQLRSQLGVLITNIISRLVLTRRFSAPVEGHGEEITEEQMLEIQKLLEITEAIPKCLSAYYPADFIPALKWFDFQGLDCLFKELASVWTHSPRR